ncbi:cytochrome P460 family protein [Agarilytica rhodophyticola]|uniref:cytochrome P460 family protein n=1 Tax=Agarilytica rhodophyticola TaxID=1737490 RepID=UPI000B3477C1|nr:cytochrome P460 family protein [Agarilytica rhodophyticola]
MRAKIIIKKLLQLSLATLALPIAISTHAQSDLSQYVNKKGNISFPQGFRSSMIHLGSWYVPEGGASGFHDVYTEKKSVEYYKKHGKFPDGATIVKELRASLSGDFTTGKNVSHATGQLKQWFVMIKDSKNRFDNNPIWGDGWGWALFKPDSLSKNAASDYKKDCQGCHLPAKDTDWLYTQAYPMLEEK